MIDILVKPVRALLGDRSQPSILEQTKWLCGFYHFPGESPSNERFNCSITHWHGRNWLATRRRSGPSGTVGLNLIEIWRLQDNQPATGHPIPLFSTFLNEHFEDPRLFIVGSRLALSYCNFTAVSFAHQVVTGLLDNFLPEPPTHVQFGQNGAHLFSNQGHEKNWCWFEHEGSLYFVYETAPIHVVCRTRYGFVTQAHRSPSFTWSYGLPRGGSPPVRVGDEFFSFFHSSLFWVKPKRRYFMGCYAFEAKFPFRITRHTLKPLLTGSEHDPRMVHHPLVVFPCGSVFNDGQWTVSLGVNDCRCAWLKIPHEQLLSLMPVHVA